MGCKRIFEEKASGARTDRPELAKALAIAREKDVLVVWKHALEDLPQMR
jgi:DNA invertase Pin-like site-specific DNA recombinase